MHQVLAVLLLVFLVSVSPATVVKEKPSLQWGPWSKCTVTCDGGFRTRVLSECYTHQVVSPSFHGASGDFSCREVSGEIQICNTNSCPGKEALTSVLNIR